MSRTDTAERYPSHNRLLRLIWHRLEHLRRYKTGTDGIDRNIGASQLQRCRFGQTNYASFGGCIVSLAKVPHLANHRADVDDLAALLLRELGQRCFRRVKVAAQIILDDLIPVLRSEIFQRAINIYTSIVDQHVYPAKLLKGLFDELGCLCGIRHISLNRYGPLCSVLLELGFQVFRSLLDLSIVYY